MKEYSPGLIILPSKEKPITVCVLLRIMSNKQQMNNNTNKKEINNIHKEKLIAIRNSW